MLHEICSRRWAAVALALVAMACHPRRKLHDYSGVGVGGGPGPMTDVTAAVVSSAVSRASGGCFAQCSPGWICNEKTGLCDPAHDGGTGRLELLPRVGMLPRDAGR